MERINELPRLPAWSIETDRLDDGRLIAARVVSGDQQIAYLLAGLYPDREHAMRLAQLIAQAPAMHSALVEIGWREFPGVQAPDQIAYLKSVARDALGEPK